MVFEPSGLFSELGQDRFVSACDCCNEPICFAPVLYCDSISASKSKCGFAEFVNSTPPRRYLVRTASSSRTCSYHSSSGGGGGGDDSSNIVTVVTFDRHTCLSSSVCSGSSSASNGVTSRSADPCTGYEACLGLGAGADLNVCGLCYGAGIFNPGIVCNGDPTAITSTSIHSSFSCFANTYSLSSSGESSTDLSNEYTTAQLIADTIALLNHYCIDFGGDADRVATTSCSAFRDLSTDELTCTIARTKWKVRHYPTASCYLKVWVRKRFRPQGTTGSADVLTDLAAYLWSGMPKDEGLCLKDSTKPPNHVDNRIDSFATEELEPPTNGTTTIEMKKWSCLEGYEPDDPLANGNRPSPDLHPNGWPPAPKEAGAP